MPEDYEEPVFSEEEPLTEEEQIEVCKKSDKIPQQKDVMEVENQ